MEKKKKKKEEKHKGEPAFYNDQLGENAGEGRTAMRENKTDKKF